MGEKEVFIVGVKVIPFKPQDNPENYMKPVRSCPVSGGIQ